MERIGIRELRQNASRWLRRVKAGESIEVTERGETVALLVPPPEKTGLEALIAAGKLRLAKRQLRDLPPPLPPKPGAPTLSEALEQLRANER